jgi:hypothetical protein
MSFLKKSDVNHHLSASFRTNAHLVQQNASGISKGRPDVINAKPNFAAEFVAEHWFTGVAVAPSGPVAASTPLQAPAVSKSAQA